MSNDATPIPHSPVAAEAATRAALDWVKGQGIYASALIAAGEEPLSWEGQGLTAPAGPLGRLWVSFRRTPREGHLELVLKLLLPPLQLYSGTIAIPAHVFAAGD